MTSPLTMTKANREAFLAALHVGVLAVADDSGGTPVAVPVWYRYEPGGDVVIERRRRRREDSPPRFLRAGDALRPAGGPALCVRERRRSGPRRRPRRGGASAARDPLPRRVAPRYLEVTASEQTVTVRLTPERWRTQDYAQLPDF